MPTKKSSNKLKSGANTPSRAIKGTKVRAVNLDNETVKLLKKISKTYSGKENVSNGIRIAARIVWQYTEK